MEDEVVSASDGCAQSGIAGCQIGGRAWWEGGDVWWDLEREGDGVDEDGGKQCEGREEKKFGELHLQSPQIA